MIGLCDVSDTERHTPKLICTNEECDCCTYDMYWNDYGDFYSGDNYKKSNELFPDHKYGALNSGAKKSEVEIYKNGLKKKTYLSPIFCFYLLQPLIEHNYKGDCWGNVLKKSYKLKFLKKDDGRFCVYYIFPISSLCWTIKRFYKDKKYYKTHKTKYGFTCLKDYFELAKWDKRWWRKLSKWYFNVFYGGLKKKIYYSDIYDK